MGQEPSVGREVLPIPDQAHVGLTTYDAKDPTGIQPSRELASPDLATMSFLYELGEFVAAGGDIRSRLFG